MPSRTQRESHKAQPAPRRAPRPLRLPPRALPTTVGRALHNIRQRTALQRDRQLPRRPDAASRRGACPPVLDRQICINQCDMDEKSNQVGLMVSICDQAAETLIWLGLSANDSDEAIGFIKRRPCAAARRAAAGQHRPHPAVRARASLRPVVVGAHLGGAGYVHVPAGDGEVRRARS